MKKIGGTMFMILSQSMKKPISMHYIMLVKMAMPCLKTRQPTSTIT